MDYYNRLHSLSDTAEKVLRLVNDVAENRPQVQYAKTKQRYQDVVTNLMQAVNKMLPLVEEGLLIPEETSDEFNELSRNLIDRINETSQNTKPADLKAVIQPTHTRKDNIFVLFDSVFADAAEMEFGYEEVDMCAKSLYRWFHTRFIDHPGIYKATELSNWVSNFILAFGKASHNNTLYQLQSHIETWCQKLESETVKYAVPYEIYKMGKQKDISEYTLEAVLISDILFSECLYRLTKQELPNSQIFLDGLAVADFVRNKNKSLATEIRTRFSKPDMAIRILRPKQGVDDE